MPAGHPFLAEHHVALPWLWEGCSFLYPVWRDTVVTGDMDITHENVEGLRSRYSAVVGDWESGAVAKVSR